MQNQGMNVCREYFLRLLLCSPRAALDDGAEERDIPRCGGKEGAASLQRRWGRMMPDCETMAGVKGQLKIFSKERATDP
jgi:hypothetical protein